MGVSGDTKKNALMPAAFPGIAQEAAVAIRRDSAGGRLPTQRAVQLRGRGRRLVGDDGDQEIASVEVRGDNRVELGTASGALLCCSSRSSSSMSSSTRAAPKSLPSSGVYRVLCIDPKLLDGRSRRARLLRC